MGVKLTALLLLSITSLLSFQGCGGDDDGDSTGTTATKEPATASSATAAPEAETTAEPEAETTSAPPVPYKGGVLPSSDCGPVKDGFDCDELMDNQYLLLMGMDACAKWEYYYYGNPVCAGCECDAPPAPACWKELNFKGVKQNCDEILADPHFGEGTANPIMDCAKILTFTGGKDVCAGCTCTPRPTSAPDVGYGYGYGYGFA